MMVAFLAIPFSSFAKKHIEMKDKHDKDEKSISFIPSVDAWLEDSGKDISLQFYRNLGEVDITIINSSGKIIYKETVNATAMSSQFIYLDTLSKGEYVLSITNSKNEIIGFL